MDTLPFILTLVQIVMSVFLIVVVLFQSGKRSGLSGAISGAAEAFMTKNKARAWDARLARMTKWVAVMFILLTIALNLLMIV